MKDVQRRKSGLLDVDGNCFHSERLGFHIEKPDHWSFLPTQWAPRMKSHIHFKTRQAQMMAQAAPPFVYIHYMHDSQRYVYPTVQAGCRVLVGELPEPDRFLAFQIQTLKTMFPNLKVLEKSDSAVLGGVSGFFIHAQFRMTRTDGVVFHCLSRAYTLVVEPLIFTVTMSSPKRGPYVCEDDFRSIAKSIRIWKSKYVSQRG